jgi:predicted house-cleaning noncanonical NTP pyrophosphatase (MazG superfamily)
MRRFKFGKLVRDKMPEILRQQGGHIVSHVLEPSVRLDHLKAKLKEEVEEVLSTITPEDLMDEIADTLEVLQTLAKNQNLSWEDIEKKRQEKQLKRGGFDSYTYVEYLEIESSDPSHLLTQYCLARPQEYPEIPIDSHLKPTADDENYQ